MGEAEVGQADIMLCIHVLYVVRDIKHFVRKLSTHGREWVVVVLFRSPPQSQLYRLWKLVHGEERLPLPGLPELDDVLQEMEIDAHLEMLPPQSSRGYEDAQQALEQIAGRLYLTPDSEKWRTLERALPDLLEETDGTFKIEGIRPWSRGCCRGAPPFRPGAYRRLHVQDDGGPAEVPRSVALAVVGVGVFPEAGPFDHMVALGHHLIRQLGVAVVPEAVAQAPVGVHPGGTSPDEAVGVSRHELGLQR